jgi:hypothetical protein
LLQTANYSSLAPCLRRASFLAFVRGLVERLEARGEAEAGELVALDSMALSLPRTQRHHCRKINDKTAGGGVLWAYRIGAQRGSCPVKVLKVVEGAWHDTTVMRTVRLAARGPIYLMDRGFYAFDLLEAWLKARVHFIVRARAKDLVYTPLRPLSRPHAAGPLKVVVDAWVCLGAPSAKRHPTLRLVVAILPSGEKLFLATDLQTWSCEKILAAYKKRWHIERFHRFLKDSIGLAHLYSFHQTGITFLLYTALLLALLLFLSSDSATGETILALRKALGAIRHAMGMGAPWKRNSCTHPRGSKKPHGKKPKTIIR